MLEAIVEILFSLLFELVFEVVGGVLLDLGIRGVRTAAKASRQWSPRSSLLAYSLVGTVLGSGSLWIYPNSFAHGAALRVVVLLVSPAFAGVAMAAVGSILRKKDVGTLRLESFGYGFLFAFCATGARFLGTM